MRNKIWKDKKIKDKKIASGGQRALSEETALWNPAKTFCNLSLAIRRKNRSI
jgi:hypothetical protein